MELYILRHAKSDWSAKSISDHDRMLNNRGVVDSDKMAHWMKDNGISPDLVLCSTAVRARQTLDPIVKVLYIQSDRISFLESLYLASLKTLLQTLSDIQDTYDSAMLIGHNPGLDELVNYIASQPPPLTGSGKLMTTACLAHFEISDIHKDLCNAGRLVKIVRPKDIH